MNRVMPSSVPRKVRGMSLIEVMVAMLVLAVGLLGIAAMQSLALRGGQGSLESTQAVIATSSMLESIRANRTQADNYNMVMTCATPAAGTTLVTRDQNAWMSALKTTIGSGAADTTTCGQISNCDDANATNCTITVRWDDSRAGGSSTRTIAVEAQI